MYEQAWPLSVSRHGLFSQVSSSCCYSIFSGICGTQNSQCVRYTDTIWSCRNTAFGMGPVLSQGQRELFDSWTRYLIWAIELPSVEIRHGARSITKSLCHPWTRHLMFRVCATPIRFGAVEIRHSAWCPFYHRVTLSPVDTAFYHKVTLSPVDTA